MAEPTLTQVFGAGAAQDGSTLTISKSALASVGLTATGSNSAESLFVAMILLAQNHLNDTNQANNINQSVSISIAATPSFITRDTSTFIRDAITIEIDKIAPTLTIDPDDY